MRVNRRDVTSVVVSAFVVATVARLIGFVGFLRSALFSPGRTLRALAEFWAPVVGPWGVLVVLGVLVAAYTGTDGTVRDADERPFEEMERGSYVPSQVDALDRVLSRSESVLQSQLEVLADTDDKAVRTVRVEIVLLGVVASAAQFAAGDLPTNVWMRVSGVLFVSSVITGIFTYSTSSPDLGPGPEYVRERIPEGPRQMRVCLELLRGYDEAIVHNHQVVNKSASYLFLTQTLLIAGILCGGIGIATTL